VCVCARARVWGVGWEVMLGGRGMRLSGGSVKRVVAVTLPLFSRSTWPRIISCVCVSVRTRMCLSVSVSVTVSASLSVSVSMSVCVCDTATVLKRCVCARACGG